MSQSTFNELRIVFDAIRRRRRLLVIITFCGILLSMLPVMLLPSIYQSTATILIESQEIPQDLVRSTVTGYVEERLQSIAQVALNRANLMGMIEQHNLYSEERKNQTTEAIIDKMRKDIAMTPIKTDVVGAGGRAMSATIAFTLTYKSKSPRQALNTTNSLVSLFLEENYRSREARATTTYDFLEKQNQDLQKKIYDIEEEIARFKEQHLTALPEMVNMNIQAMERTQREIEVRRESIKSANERKIYLEGQLATLSPTRAYSGTDGRPSLQPAEELKVLRNQYISMSATRSEKHPDIIALKQKIANLEAHVGDNSAAIADLQNAKVHQETKLAGLKASYTDNHPEVLAAINELAAIDQLLKTARANKGKGSASQIVPDNPAYVTVQTQLQSVNLELANSLRSLDELEKKYDDYQKRLETSPQIEQDYRKLQRDLTITQAQYQENTAKLLAASEAKVLEEERAGERLTLIDPPVLPEEPVSPNRLLILMAGAVLSVGLGGGVVAIREFLDNTLHGTYKILSMTRLPVLVSIPYYATREEKKRRSRQRKTIVLIGVALLIGMIIFFHFAVMPLDILFYTIQNKLKLYF